MQFFTVKQIILSDELVAKVNDPDTKTPAAYYMYLNAIDDGNIWDAWAADMFTDVALIEAEDLEDVFRIGNIGPEDNIQRLAPMHSVSVGDIVVDEDGNMHVVARYGFKSFDPMFYGKDLEEQKDG